VVRAAASSAVNRQSYLIASDLLRSFITPRRLLARHSGSDGVQMIQTGHLALIAARPADMFPPTLQGHSCQNGRPTSDSDVPFPLTFFSLLPQTLRRRRRRPRSTVEVDERLRVARVVAVVLGLVDAVRALVTAAVLVHGQGEQQEDDDDRRHDANNHGDPGRQRADAVSPP